ncbi:MAG: CotO family spore coat protein [Ectobacillus sp.]
MAQKRRMKEQPLLYIAQPSFTEAKLNMQETFIIKRETKQQEETEQQPDEAVTALADEPIGEQEVIEAAVHLEETAEPEAAEEERQLELKAAATESLAEEAPLVEEAEETAAEDAKTEQEQEPIAQEEDQVSQVAWRAKSFKEMDNDEKLEFLINRPHYIPRVRCRIKTVQELIVGYVVSRQGDDVTIKIFGKAKERQISFQDIVSIQMIGL